jgi:hypothetical protein
MIAIKRKRSIKLGKSNHIFLAANLKRAEPYKCVQAVIMLWN